jgi:hypothetical protein
LLHPSRREGCLSGHDDLALWCSFCCVGHCYLVMSYSFIRLLEIFY